VNEHSDAGPIVSRIRRHYEDLPPSERRLADFILDFPGDIASYSATELAELAGASKAAATRLVRRLGFKSYEEARRSARDAQDWGSPLYLLRKKSGAGLAPALELKRHLERDIANMARTFEVLDPDQLEEIVDTMTGARRLWLLGYRNSHILAAYARGQFFQVRDDVHLLPPGIETLSEFLAGIDERDLLIVIGFRRRPQQLRRAMKAAAATGAAILYITDPTARQTAALAKWTLCCEVGGVGVLDSYSSAMALMHYLGIAMVRKTAGAGRRRLKRIEDLHEDLHDFD
jgi:DNA-binding MurR/RpiR family transcriptional regulator